MTTTPIDLDKYVRFEQEGSREKRTVISKYHLDTVTLEDPHDGTFHAVLTFHTSHSKDQRAYWTTVTRSVQGRRGVFTISRGGFDFGLDYPGGQRCQSIRTPGVTRYSATALQQAHLEHREQLIAVAGGFPVLLDYARGAINQGWAR